MFERIEKNGTVIYKSTLLSGVAHGFSTRLGGVSSGDTASLNVGYDRGDDDGTVNENRRILAAACGIEPVGSHVLVSASQVHSARIEYVTPSTVTSDFVCDGFLTDMPRIPIMVKTADCVPILLWESGAGVAAAVHAGWRGTARGIAGFAVQRMCELGAKRDRIRAAIGPCICPDCFEVSDDFGEQFRSLASTSPNYKMRVAADGMITDFIVRGGDGVLHCDLVSINERLLVLSGVHARNVDCARICTKEHPDEFYSHRRDGAARGVMGAAIML